MAFSARLAHPSADFLPPFTLPQTKAYYVTVPSKKIAYSISRTLVESKLAACVNIIPGVESVYTWEDKVRTPLRALSLSLPPSLTPSLHSSCPLPKQVEKDQELLLMIKSRAGLLDKIVKRVKQEHEYDTPEVSKGAQNRRHGGLRPPSPSLC